MTPAANLIEVACDLALLGEGHRQSGRRSEAMGMMAQAYSAALMGCSGVLAAAQFAALPHLAHIEHAELRIQRQSLRLQVSDEALERSLTYLRRLSIIGHLSGILSRSLPSDTAAHCVVDLSDGMDVGEYPRFAYSSASPLATLLPDPYFFETTGYEDLRRQVVLQARPWEERRDIVFWRGAAAGRPNSPWGGGEEVDLACLPRLLMCLKGKPLEKVDIGVTCLDQIGAEHVRRAIAAAGLIRPEVDKAEFMQYRYLIDIDGNSNAWGLIEKMVMGATILKVASRDGFRQWFYDRLTPWTHFVPVAADLSDFESRVDWLFSHPGPAREIAANAAALAEELNFKAAMREAEERFSSNVVRG